MKLAIFVDQIFWKDGDVISSDESYTLFPASFINFVDEIEFIGRGAPERGRGPYVLNNPAITLCALPYYKNLYSLWKENPRIYTDIRTIIQQHAQDWDAVMICGPNPIGQLIARMCIDLNLPIFLIVRQNLVQQMNAHQGLKRQLAVAMARTLEWDFKRMARGRTVFTVGQEMADEYGRFSEQTYNHFPCLVTDAQYRMFAAMPSGADPTRLLCVCRLSPEKGHRYLFEALVRLRERGLVCHLDLIGTGALEQELKSKVAELGLTEQVTFHGYVPYGPALFPFYRNAGAMVLSSLTEGFPQVINESLCMGLPTIASAVGGIPDFLTDGETAMLVPPSDVAALTAAIERVVREPHLRDRLRQNGRNLMRDNTLEANRDRIMRIMHYDTLPIYS